MQTSTLPATSFGLGWPVMQRKLREENLAATVVREVTSTPLAVVV
jgi:hypothetical protein